ncbi:MAG TPA: DinB family protein [Chthonomonadales bacterium]|nr:DinB family protein [Chthonomonadales bacterium]
MSLTADVVRDILALHYDRRSRCLDFLTSLTDEERSRPIGPAFGSLAGVLLHCLDAEEYWVQRAIGGREPLPPSSVEDADALRERAAQVHGRTMAAVAGLNDEALRRTVVYALSDGVPRRAAVARILLHVVTHDFHHRGQIAAIASQRGQEPPSMDIL